METQTLFEAAEERWFSNWQKGPTRRRWNSLPVQAGDPAPDFQLRDSSGQLRSLSEFWKDRPALLIFWRHFGCGCGVGRAERLKEEHDRLVSAGANVAIIGQGEPERASWYKGKFSVPCPILCDADEGVYRAYELLECSPWLLMGKSKPSPEYLQSVIISHREKGRRVADNPFLLPGEFVVDTNGRLVLTYRYHYCDNYPDVEALIESVHEATSQSVKDVSSVRSTIP